MAEDPEYITSANKKFTISQTLMKLRSLHQEIIEIENYNKVITSLRISEVFGRFGNNFYQITNSIIIAKQLDISEIQIPHHEYLPSRIPFVSQNISFTDHLASQKRNTLSGSFFAPFGLEDLFSSLSAQDVYSLVKPVIKAYYADLVDFSIEKSKNIAVAHFRGGDIFRAYGHPWYVQPPASAYIVAIMHALKECTYDEIYLVAEDQSNPALSAVENYLSENEVRFSTIKGELEDDLGILLSASCLISSSSTLPEAAAAISNKLERYYSFRSHSSQIDFAPFMQSRIGSFIRSGGARTFIVDDANFGYTPQKSWINAPEQVQKIVDYDIRCLRLFETHSDL